MRPVQLFLRNGVGGAHDNGSTFGEVPVVSKRKEKGILKCV
jgi:hypothetical protein